MQTLYFDANTTAKTFAGCDFIHYVFSTYAVMLLTYFLPVKQSFITLLKNDSCNCSQSVIAIVPKPKKFTTQNL